MTWIKAKPIIEFTELSIQDCFAKSRTLMEKYIFVVPCCKLTYDSESDLVGFKRNGYVEEFEIKISKQDFNNDIKKTVLVEGSLVGSKKRYVKENKFDALRTGCFVPNYFNYIVPINLVTVEDVPDFAGLYYVNQNGSIFCVKKPKRLHNRKMSVETQLQHCKKLSFRYWASRIKKSLLSE